jgi:membrane-bound ClpP family serine protease
MNFISRTITGGVLILVGLILIGLSLLTWVTLIYGVPLFLIGLFIFFNKKEDKIEERKDLKTNSHK